MQECMRRTDSKQEIVTLSRTIATQGREDEVRITANGRSTGVSMGRSHGPEIHEMVDLSAHLNRCETDALCGVERLK